MKSVSVAIAGLMLAATTLSASAAETFVYRKPAAKAVCAEANCALSDKVAITGATKPTTPETPESTEIVWSWASKTSSVWQMQLDGKTWVVSANITDPDMNTTEIVYSAGVRTAIFEWDSTLDWIGLSASYKKSEGHTQHIEIVLENTAGKRKVISEDY